MVSALILKVNQQIKKKKRKKENESDGDGACGVGGGGVTCQNLPSCLRSMDSTEMFSH